MSHFFIDNYPQPDGTHEVHCVGCKRMPADKRYLGNYTNVADALMEGRKDFWQASGCEHCSQEEPTSGSGNTSRIGTLAFASWGRFR